LPTETEKIVTAKDDVLDPGDDVLDGAVTGVDAGGGFIAVAAGSAGSVEKVGALVGGADALFGVQLKMAVKIKKDRTNMVKALPYIILLFFIGVGCYI
jgi:ABC-type uncharacterized transport system permease subunit